VSVVFWCLQEKEFVAMCRKHFPRLLARERKKILEEANKVKKKSEDV